MGKQMTKEVSVKEAQEKSRGLSEQKLKDGIFEEALKLYRKETYSIQQLLAYAKGLDDMGKLPKKDEKKPEQQSEKKSDSKPAKK